MIYVIKAGGMFFDGADWTWEIEGARKWEWAADAEQCRARLVRCDESLEGLICVSAVLKDQE